MKFNNSLQNVQVCYILNVLYCHGEQNEKKKNFRNGDIGKSWMNFQRAKIITLGGRLIMKDEPP